MHDITRSILQTISCSITTAYLAGCMVADDAMTNETSSALLSPFANAMTNLGPVGWWRLGETTGVALDSTSGGNSGTYVNFLSSERGVAGAVANDTDGAIKIAPDAFNNLCSDGNYVEIADNDRVSFDKAQDYFGRTVAPGTSWGTADVGGSWAAQVTTSGTYYSVNGSVAQIAESVAATWQIGLPITRANADIQIRASWSVAAAGGVLAPVAIVARRIDNSNYYRAELRENPGGQLDLQIGKVVGGQYTPLATKLNVGAYAVNDTWYLRFQLDGSNLRARAWKQDGTLPIDWQATASDASFTSGTISVRSANSNTTSRPIVSFDAFRVQSLGMTVHLFMKPSTLSFGNYSYVHFAGKGLSASEDEWAYRFYPSSASPPNRTSGYMWSLDGNLGAGAHWDPSTSNPISANTWYELVVVYDPGDMFDPTAGVSFYKDGVCTQGTRPGCPPPTSAVYYQTYSIIPENGTAPLRIGTRDCHQFFTGSIDELAVFDRRLTATEIQNLHSAAQ
jgi:hypothetical protein